MEEVAATIDVAGAMVLMNGVAKQQPNDFKWTHERCMLLLHEYDLLKDKFKDRKHKKKDLWAEISMKFKKIYAYDLEWDVAYKKFRNLKQTFEQARAKMHQQAITGQTSNRPKWPYYEKFAQILDDPAIVSYGFPDHQALQQHDEEKDHLHHHHHVDDPSQLHQAHHHHHHHAQQHQQHQQHHQQHHGNQHPQFDPATTVGHVLSGDDFSDALVTVFPMGEELEIPAEPPPQVPSSSEGVMEDAKIEHQEVETVADDEEERIGGGQLLEEDQEELVDAAAPHRKRFRRRNSYQQERLEIEREKLDTLREIQRGIDCNNDIFRGILHVLQSRIWEAHPAKD